jgi:hypothetical protein
MQLIGAPQGAGFRAKRGSKMVSPKSGARAYSNRPNHWPGCDDSWGVAPPLSFKLKHGFAMAEFRPHFVIAPESIPDEKSGDGDEKERKGKNGKGKRREGVPEEIVQNDSYAPGP